MLTRLKRGDRMTASFDKRKEDMNSGPIIRSLLDVDFYKLTMMQVAWKYFRHVPVRYALKNRTKDIHLGDFIHEAELRQHLAWIQQLAFTPEEIEFLRKSKFIESGLFSEDFLKYLKKDFRLSPIVLRKKGSDLEVEVFGSWPEAILWETLILSVVNELYGKGELRKIIRPFSWARNQGERRLAEKIKVLKTYPEIKFSDFGTRRRFSRDWQEYVIHRLKKELPNQILGTSNIYFAKQFDLKPIGTFAHEMFMVLSCLNNGSDEEIRASHNRVLKTWEAEYGDALSIALTDTFGTDFFFKDFTKEQAQSWHGLRQDSGDPFVFGEKSLAFYSQHGIDPKTKTIVFSDGLDVSAIVALHKKFSPKINVLFGWGTNLTNDMGIKPLSLVVKVIEACDRGTVKLSDNISKAMGKVEDVERFKRIFGHTSSFNEPCKY